MKHLGGEQLLKFPFANLFKIGDLVHYQGPLLSLFSNTKGELYLFDWSDTNEKYNRWLVFRITLSQLIQYLNKNLSHYQLISTFFTDFIVSVDIDDDFTFHNVTLLNVKDIPDDYLPEKDVFHEDYESPHLEKIKAYINHLELEADKTRKKQWQ